ncbi:Uncharacterised protein [Rhodococcus coprophilus]|uniref:Uncharacterized protein n=2 Tax=Rhodococcus coprophilus TaxID=38310 RepID=A0A2X4U6N1_9NOCA|nr:Uncharacterised protein [Rhodococcus coprophilus]
MVSGRKHRALLLYLLLLWSWRWLKDSREPLASDVWLRALTAEDVTGSLTWSQSALSRAWRDLEHFGLIEDRVRDGRLLKVVPRREDSLAAYRAPAGERDRHNKYFTLPNTFWIDKYFAKLKLPGLAMLLIIAKETSGGPERPIPFNRVAEWYGISSRTAQNGVAELEALGLVHKRYEVKDAPLSKTGSTTWIHYSLTGPFSYEARMLAQQAAQIARTKNSNPVPNPPPASSANTPAVDAKPAVAG